VIKPIRFLGDSLRRLRAFPDDARQDAGYQLDKLQRGSRPDDFRPTATVGAGAEEIRVWGRAGTYRVIYVAKFADALYVLHAFEKKSAATSRFDVELARRRYGEMTSEAGQ
jgi:phage-related protein